MCLYARFLRTEIYQLQFCLKVTRSKQQLFYGEHLTALAEIHQSEFFPNSTSPRLQPQTTDDEGVVIHFWLNQVRKAHSSEVQDAEKDCNRHEWERNKEGLPYSDTSSPNSSAEKVNSLKSPIWEWLFTQVRSQNNRCEGTPQTLPCWDYSSGILTGNQGRLPASYLFLKDPETIFSRVRITKEIGFDSKNHQSSKVLSARMWLNFHFLTETGFVMDGLLPTVLLDFREAHFIPVPRRLICRTWLTCPHVLTELRLRVNVPRTSLLLNGANCLSGIKDSSHALWDDDGNSWNSWSAYNAPALSLY